MRAVGAPLVDRQARRLCCSTYPLSAPVLVSAILVAFVAASDEPLTPG
jgi:hypothetical protein